MKKSILVLIAVLMLTANANAGVIFDDFNDGNTDGWLFPYNSAMSQGPGDWSVENGVLVQHVFGDANSGLVDNLLISDQTIEVQTSSAGYAGVVLWYQQVNNTLANYISFVINPYSSGLSLGVIKDGQATKLDYQYRTWPSQWYDLRVDANSSTGELNVFVDDAFVFSYQADTPYRTGLSGVYSGNYYGYFDNFRLTSNDIQPIPEPSTILLLGFGLLGAGRYRRRKN